MARSGLIIVDKPAGMTSHDVVGRVRRIAGTRKVGHAGTLDPMATGVLVLGIERATKLLGYLTGHDKSYDATIRLGASTVTDDAEGEVTGGASAAGIAEAAVRAGLATMVGDIEQIPSSVSAIKVGGKRSYARVRAGEDVELKARPVTIHALDVHAVRRPTPDLLDVEVSVTCSAGTYIRAIARDLGEALGCGGHLVGLRRTRSGDFGLDDALTLDALAERAEPVVIDLDAAVARSFPLRRVDAEEAGRLAHGGRLAADGRSGVHGVAGPDGQVIALVEEAPSPGGAAQARPVVVLRPAGG